MNLEEIITYRNNCPICKAPLMIKSENSGYKISVFDDYFKVDYKGPNVRNIKFYYNGAYKANTTFDNYPNYLSDVIIRKYCKTCFVKGKTMDSYAGNTFLDRIAKAGYYYSFKCKVYNGTFTPIIIREYFSLQQGKCLNIIDNHFLENKLCLDKFTTIDDRWIFDTESKDLRHFKDEEDFINLINLYSTFS